MATQVQAGSQPQYRWSTQRGSSGYSGSGGIIGQIVAVFTRPQAFFQHMPNTRHWMFAALIILAAAGYGAVNQISTIRQSSQTTAAATPAAINNMNQQSGEGNQPPGQFDPNASTGSNSSTGATNGSTNSDTTTDVSISATVPATGGFVPPASSSTSNSSGSTTNSAADPAAQATPAAASASNAATGGNTTTTNADSSGTTSGGSGFTGRRGSVGTGTGTGTGTTTSAAITTISIENTSASSLILLAVGGFVATWLGQAILFSLVPMLNGYAPNLGRSFQLAVWASLPFALMLIVRQLNFAAGGTGGSTGLSLLTSLWTDYSKQGELVQRIVSTFLSNITLFWVWNLLLLYIGARYVLNGNRLSVLLVMIAWIAVSSIAPALIGSPVTSVAPKATTTTQTTTTTTGSTSSGTINGTGTGAATGGFQGGFTGGGGDFPNGGFPNGGFPTGGGGAGGGAGTGTGARN